MELERGERVLPNPLIFINNNNTNNNNTNNNNYSWDTFRILVAGITLYHCENSKEQNNEYSPNFDNKDHIN